LGSILDALDVLYSKNEDESIAYELDVARSHAHVAFVNQPLLTYSVDDILAFDWERLFAICLTHHIPVNGKLEEQDFVNDLVLNFLVRQRELVASRILPSKVCIRDGYEVSGGTSTRITFREKVLLCHVLLALFALDLHLWSKLWQPRKRYMKTFWTPQAPKNMAN
jgi:hypothetical protein